MARNAAEVKYDSTHRAQRAVAARTRMATLRAKDPEGYNEYMRQYRKSETGQAAVKKHMTSDKRHQYIRARRERPDVIAQEKAYQGSPTGKAVMAKAKNTYRLSGRQKDSTLKARYGISLAEHDEMLLAQNKVCAICGKPSSKPFHVDHDHVTAKVRGLLCFKCNSGLGMFCDDISVLRAAIEYLTKQIKEI